MIVSPHVRGPLVGGLTLTTKIIAPIRHHHPKFLSVIGHLFDAVVRAAA